MEQQGLTVQDMVPLIGATNRVYEVLNETRPLTLSMMKRISIGLKISGDVLLGQKMAGENAKPVRKTRRRNLARGLRSTAT
jgi:HTH-type transcriptional regulator/antitoxin HigA